MSARRLTALVGLALVAWIGCRRAAHVEPVQPAAEVAALEARRGELRERLARALRADQRLAAAPAADVLIGMPAAFSAALARELTSGFLAQVEIHLRDLRVRKQDEVKVKALVATVRAGSYVVDATVHEVRALLRPGEPKLSFKGNRIELALPVRLADGRGRATVDFTWDSQGMGKAVCEDFHVTQAVSAGVTPRTYEMRGAFVLEVEGGALVARPEFGDVTLRVNVEPTAETWQALERVIQERSWKCEKALGLVDVPKLLRGMLAKGFDVRLPRKLFRPVRLPAAFDQTLVLEGKSYALSARPVDLTLAPGLLWYGADLELRATR